MVKESARKAGGRGTERLGFVQVLSVICSNRSCVFLESGLLSALTTID